MSPSRASILRLINASQHTACPCHGARPHLHPHGQLAAVNQLRNFAFPVDHVQKEYAFEVTTAFPLLNLNLDSPPSHQVAASNLRFGDGVTSEVGMDLKNMKARKVRGSSSGHLHKPHVL